MKNSDTNPLKAIFRFWKDQQATIRSGLTLLGLLAIGAYGHFSHWTLPGMGHPHSAAESQDHNQSSHKPSVSAAASPANSALAKPAPGPSPTGSPKTSSPESTLVTFRSPQAIDKSGIEVIPVTPRTMRHEVPATGTVSYDQRNSARLSTRVPGSVWKVEAHQGDEVRKGQILALIESVEVGKLKTNFAQELVEVELREATVARLKSAGEGVSKRQLLEAEMELRVSRIALLSAEQALVNLGFAVQYEEYEKLSDEQVIRKLQFLGLPEDLARTLDAQKTTSNLIPLFAPFDGVIIGRDVGLGEIVTIDRHLYEIADLRKMWILLDVRKEDSLYLAPGQKVVYEADGIPHPLESTVSWISTEVDESTRTLRVRAEVENPLVKLAGIDGAAKRMLRANSFGKGKILVREAAETMTLPQACLQKDDQGLLVFVKTGADSFEGRRVTRGLTDGAFTEIIGPIASGDLVAAHGSHILKSKLMLDKLSSSQQ